MYAIDLSKNADFGMAGQGVENLFWRCLMPVRWEESGEINAIKTLSGQRRYDIDSYI